MGTTTIFDLLMLLKKNPKKIIAAALIFGMLAYFYATLTQTYTAQMNLKYNNPEAEEGLAPDGSALDPYDIMNPTVISGTLENLGDTGLSVEDVRNQMSVEKVLDTQTTELQQSKSELGEEYEVFATEYAIKYSYPAKKGEEFGHELFSSLVKAYDDWYAEKYYRKNKVVDFMKLIDTDNMEYMDICESMETNLNSITSDLYAMSDSDPGFRSENTGYTFYNVADCYQHLYDVDYKKYYANVRNALLCKDKELLIKSYATKIKDNEENLNNNYRNSEMYKGMISTFYDPYKASNLYSQAARTQSAVGESNTNKDSMIYDYDLSLLVNTYDDIVLSYTETGKTASELQRENEFYNKVIAEYQNDMVAPETKNAALALNEEIFKDMQERVAEYTVIANKTIEDYYNQKIADNLKYLVATSVTPTKSIPFIVVLAIIIGGGFMAVYIVFAEVFKKWYANRNYDDKLAEMVREENLSSEEMENLSEEEKAVYNQYKRNFDEFYLAYQAIVGEDGECRQSEVFIRWNSNELNGEVPPSVFLPVFEKMSLLDELNEWIIRKACEGLKKLKAEGVKKHIININCASANLLDDEFENKLLDIIDNYGIKPSQICLEMDSENLDGVYDKIENLKNAGIKICIDKCNELFSMIDVVCQMGIDMVKVDQKQIDETVHSNGYAYLGSAIEKIGRCGVEICMMGVETRQQKETAKNIGIKYQQGWLYNRPMKLEEYAETMFDKE